MGYRKKSDGTWEQPIEAEARLNRRAVRNFAAATALGTAVIGGVIFGMSLCAESNVLSHGQTDQEKVAGGLLMVLFSTAAGAFGAVPLSKSIRRTERSLDAVRKDIRDGVEVTDRGVTVRPEEKVFLGLA